MQTQIYGGAGWAALSKLNIDPRSRLSAPAPEDAQVTAAVETLVGACHGASVRAGWWNDLATGESLIGRRNVPEMLMLIVSEIAEAMEAFRKSLADDKLTDRPGIEVECADAIIRIMDLGGALGMDLPGAVAAKLEFNRNRDDHKPENRALAGGKSF